MVPKPSAKNIVSLVELRNRCPNNQIQQLENFLDKRGTYTRRLLDLKDIPAIDWDFYKRNVRSEKVEVVCELEEKYKNYVAPYPEDKYSHQIDKMKAELAVEVANFIKKSNERIAKYEEEIKRIKSLLPYEQMTWEDYINAYPEQGPDFLNRPTFWPHEDSEQLGYVEEDDVIEEEDKKKPKKVKK